MSKLGLCHITIRKHMRLLRLVEFLQRSEIGPSANSEPRKVQCGRQMLKARFFARLLKESRWKLTDIDLRRSLQHEHCRFWAWKCPE